MTRRELFMIMQRQNLDSINDKLEYLENHLLQLNDFTARQIKTIKQDLSRFKSEMKSRWTKAVRREDYFLQRNEEWLQGTFTLPKAVGSAGRPSKLFQESSERTKRRKTEELRKETDLGMLTYATRSKLGESGKRDASLVLKEIISTPHRATKYKKAFSHIQLKSGISQLSTTQALSMFVEASLSRKQYEIIRSSHKKLYPCYSLLQKAKLECYPDKEGYLVTETCAEVNLQSLLDHTATRLLTYLEELLELHSEENNEFVLMCKWGCDGAQQVQYKQRFGSDTDSDSNLFQSSFVPLQLKCSKSNKVVWQNPTPSSPRYCRPIRIRFMKETTDITNEEINYVKTAINNLQQTEVRLADKNYNVKYIMMFTMIDGKVCNAVTNTTSTMRCYICGLTSKDFNNLEMKKEAKPETLNFGLSILHARIRLFESILHLSYKLPVKKWQLRTDIEKAALKEKKKQVQDDFRQKMGLIVDVPKPGYGNTNDGNTSRRFFGNHELAAEITGVDINFIYRLKIILEVLSSGYRVNTETFSAYAKETAELYVQLYPWHPMTPTMHKILIHGPMVIENALLPIGQLSEEASEARNKHFRVYRQNFARKFSRVSCNMDVFNRLLLTSDPIITGMRSVYKKKSKPFSKETLTMLRPPSPNTDTMLESSTDEEEVITDSDEEEWNSTS